MNMTKTEKRIYEAYSIAILSALKSVEKDSIFYAGICTGIEEACTLTGARTEFSALLSRTYQEYSDYVAGESNFDYDELIVWIKKGWC